MNRRLFFSTCAAAAGLGSAVRRRDRAPRRLRAPLVMTVTGPVEAAEMGLTLPHEHVLVDFAGAEEIRPGRYDRDEVFGVVLPYLETLHERGCRTVAECTPAYLARDPILLRTLSEATGLQILTNTGYYGARQDQHLPPHAFREAPDGLANRWVREWEEGIDGTGIRPGFIKIGVDDGALSDMDRKLVRAAARTHLRTGLTIAAHTGPARAAFEELDVLAEEGVHPSAWIWVHAQSEEDLSRHVAAARQGAWVEFDGFRPDRTARYVELVENMQRHGLLHRVLLSQDAGWYHVGEPGGGAFRPYDGLLTELVPALREAGFPPEVLRQVVVTNPAEAFGIRVRARQ